MNGMRYIDDTIEKKLLDLHTAYVARVLSVSGTTAKIQPLGMTKQIGEKAQAKQPISGIPIAKSAQYKITEKEITYISDVSLSESKADGYVSDVSLDKTTKSETIAVLTPIAKGDIVICVCADRDITEAKKGNNSVPSVGHHSMSDSVIVGIL